jgi:hypothetical protein
MNKPYWSGAGSRAGSGYADEDVDAPTSRISTPESPADDHGTGFYSSGGYRTTDQYRSSTSDGYDDEYDDDEYDDGYRSDIRWRVVAGIAVAVLLAAVLAIVMVTRSDDTTPAAQTEDALPATSTAPRTVVATIPPSADPPPPAQLSPETIVTITTDPPAPVHAAPPPEIPAAPLAEAPPEAAPPPPGSRTVTYSVTGTRQLFDLVSIFYTDEQGLPRTDVNVALPWNRTMVLNPGVSIESVTATSISGQLNCAITDEAGEVVVAQSDNSMIATCTG